MVSSGASDRRSRRFLMVNQDKPSGLVNHRHELGGKPASTTADSLPLSRFLRRVNRFFCANTVLVDLGKGSVDHHGLQ